MTYAEMKANGYTVIIYTTYYGHGNYIANDREENPDNDGAEFFTPEQARRRVEDLQHRGYIHNAEYIQYPRPNTYTYEVWDDTEEYLNDLIAEEEQGII